MNLIVFVEGPSDVRFFEWYYRQYSKVDFKIVDCSKRSDEYVNNYIRSIKSMPNCDYILFRDADEKSVNKAKRDLEKRFYMGKSEKFFVVQKEIESWYLAGIKDNIKLSYLKLKPIGNTDNISKEQFISMLDKSTSYINVLIEILKIFDVYTATRKNTTFNIFHKSRVV